MTKGSVSTLHWCKWVSHKDNFNTCVNAGCQVSTWVSFLFLFPSISYEKTLFLTFFFMNSAKITHWLTLLIQSLNCSTASQLHVAFVLSAKSKGLRTMRFRLGHDISHKQHNMPWTKFWDQMPILQRVGQNN